MTVERDDQRSIEEPVAAFAGGLGEEETSVTGGSVDELFGVDGLPLGTEGVGRAPLRVLERISE